MTRPLHRSALKGDKGSTTEHTDEPEFTVDTLWEPVPSVDRGEFRVVLLAQTTYDTL
jgi:hypothetical protein